MLVRYGLDQCREDGLGDALANLGRAAGDRPRVLGEKEGSPWLFDMESVEDPCVHGDVGEDMLGCQDFAKRSSAFATSQTARHYMVQHR